MSQFQTGESLLLQHAEEASRCKVSLWIRAALREAALQSLKTDLKVEKGEAGDKTRVSVSNDAFKDAQDFCQQVADKWAEKMKAIGHESVAEWIQEITSQGISTLFFSESSDGSTVASMPSPSRDTGNTIAASQNQNQQSTDFPSTQSRKRKAHTVWGRLCEIGEHDILAAEDNYITPSTALQQLNELGMSSTNAWYPWNVIQEATAEIESRLYNAGDDTELNLIPKSVWEKQQQQEQEQNRRNGNLDVNEDASTIFLMKRKKKIRFEKKRKSIRPIVTDATYDGVVADDQPRPPCPYGDFQFAIKDVSAEWTHVELQRVHGLLHENDIDETTIPTSLLLGALRDVGRFHFYNQFPVDSPDQNQNPHESDMPEKQFRGRQRRAFFERLGDHEREEISGGNTIRNWNKRMRVSRVLQTVECANGGGRQEERYWFDLDLGNCMLELVDPTSKTKKLYSFSSLELMLLDQYESNFPRIAIEE